MAPALVLPQTVGHGEETWGTSYNVSACVVVLCRLGNDKEIHYVHLMSGLRRWRADCVPRCVGAYGQGHAGLLTTVGDGPALTLMWTVSLTRP